MRAHLVFLLLINFHLCYADDAGQRIVKAHVAEAIAELEAIDTPENNQCWDPRTWDANGFHKTTLSPLVLTPTESKIAITHEATFSVILFRNAGWDYEKVRAAFQKAAEIYAQCGIRLRLTTVVETESFEGVELDLNQVRKVTDATPPNLPKPWIYFLSQPLGTGGKVENAYAFTRAVGAIHSHYDTIWMGSYTLTSHYKLDRDPSYSPLAHEIAHVLGDYDHVTGVRNILTGDPVGFANDKITAEQCAKFKTHSSVKPIL